MIKLGQLSIAKEQPGVISDTACWVIVHKCWMYGPYEQLWRCFWDMIVSWKHDRNLVG